MNAVPYTEEQDKEMTTLRKVTTVKDLQNYYLNPFNIRELSDITIKPISTEVKAEDGTVQREPLTNNEGHIVGFELDPDATVSVEYRESFNQFLDSLVKVEKGKASYQAVMPFKTTSKIPLFTGELKEDGTPITGYTVIEGNTRLFILNQLIEYLGEDNVDFRFDAFNDSECDNSVAYLMAAPSTGNNSSVPVLGDATTQANKAFAYGLKQAQESLGYVGMKATEEALKLVKKVLKLAGKSDAFFTYYKTIKLVGDNYLDDVSRKYLNLEFQYRYCNFWSKVDKGLKDGESLDELMELASLVRYIEDGLGYDYLNNFKIITTSKRYKQYEEWANNQLNPPEDEEETEGEETEKTSASSSSSTASGKTTADGDSSESDDDSEGSSTTKGNSNNDYEFTQDDLQSLSNSFHFIAECYETTDKEVLLARTSHVIKAAKTAIEILLDNDGLAKDVLSFIATKIESVDVNEWGDSLKKLTSNTDKLTKALTTPPAE